MFDVINDIKDIYWLINACYRLEKLKGSVCARAVDVFGFEAEVIADIGVSTPGHDRGSPEQALE